MHADDIKTVSLLSIAVVCVALVIGAGLGAIFDQARLGAEILGGISLLPVAVLWLFAATFSGPQ